MIGSYLRLAKLKTNKKKNFPSTHLTASADNSVLRLEQLLTHKTHQQVRLEDQTKHTHICLDRMSNNEERQTNIERLRQAALNAASKNLSTSISSETKNLSAKDRLLQKALEINGLSMADYKKDEPKKQSYTLNTEIGRASCRERV